MDDFEWQLNRLCNDNRLSSTYKDETITPCTNEKKVVVNSIEEDIKKLKEKYGELTPGKSIEIDLRSACTLLGRTRIRSDTFSKLIKYLDENLQVKLKIKSRKNK